MATSIPVSNLKIGEKISENVITKYNNVLFHKGRIINERDVDILRAFMIASVQIETKSEPEAAPEAAIEVPDTGKKPFYDHYDRMLKLLRQVFNNANARGQNPPILEIRTTLEDLIRHIDQYNILTFSPRNFQINDFIYHNSIMVALTSYILAKWSGMPSKDLLPVAMGGLLHDIGNALVDPAILFKPNRLSSDELEEMKKHTILGYNLLKNVPAINEGIKLCALQHHEREDGSGYPLGVRSDKIHPYSKIVAVADMFHAMTSDRSHKKAASPYLVLEQIKDEAFGKMEPSLVQIFVDKVTSFHNGTLVRLSDNRIGEIVFSERSHPTRPWVNVNGKIINLTLERQLYIQEVIQK